MPLKAKVNSNDYFITRQKFCSHKNFSATEEILFKILVTDLFAFLVVFEFHSQKRARVTCKTILFLYLVALFSSNKLYIKYFEL